jgi:uncharacterized RDD family membrane protein YckC
VNVTPGPISGGIATADREADVSPAGDTQLGSRGFRFVAQFIDGLVIFVPVVLVSAVTKSYALAGVLYLAALLLYAPLLLARTGRQNGQTVGKQALGLRVVPRHETTTPVTFGHACRRELLGRTLINVVTFGLYGLVDSLWCLFDPHKQTLHDKVGATIVVKA